MFLTDNITIIICVINILEWPEIDDGIEFFVECTGDPHQLFTCLVQLPTFITCLRRTCWGFEVKTH